MKLTGKKILVTGASDGIGRSIAKSFANAGAKVIAVGRNNEALEQFAKENKEIIPKVCDITKPEQIRELFNWLADESGTLDVIVNNAGIWQKESDLTDVDDKIIAEVINANLLGTIYCTKYALPLLRKSDEAAIVNIVSKSGVVAQKWQSVYTASKYGTRGFTDVLRVDLKDESIQIMGVYQSGTNTQLFAKTGEDFAVEKFTEPDDLADLIVRCVGGPAKLWVPELRVAYE